MFWKYKYHNAKNLQIIRMHCSILVMNRWYGDFKLKLCPIPLKQKITSFCCPFLISQRKDKYTMDTGNRNLIFSSKFSKSYNHLSSIVMYFQKFIAMPWGISSDFLWTSDSLGLYEVNRLVSTTLNLREVCQFMDALDTSCLGIMT